MKGREILNDLVSFNTIRDKENKEIMDYIENYLKGYNFETKRVEKCLIAYNDPNPNVGFVGHTDTVDYGSWDGDPFTLTEDNGKLIGLGACDMKGGLASILAVIGKIDLNKNKIALYFTNDEEISLGGIKSIKDIIVPNNVIIGEPTNNVPIYGTKGLLEFFITFKGIKCHSSTPDKGKSAILECVSFINKIEEYYNKVLKKDIVIDFEVPYTTMNIGKINGGETENSVPGKCTITIDFRIAKKDHVNKIKKKVNKLLTKYDSECIINFEVLPNINNNDISFLEEVSCKKQTKCYLTEGSFIDKNFIILGPGPDTSHQKNEYITIESLNKTVELYIKIIEYYNKKSEYQ
jgi:acetylornithine deacetylase